MLLTRGLAAPFAALLLCSCASAPATGPSAAGPASPAAAAVPREPTFHDLLAGKSPVPARTAALLEAGGVRRDSTGERGGRAIRSVVYDLRLGGDEYMVLREGAIRPGGAGEDVYLYALFSLASGRTALARLWRDADGGGIFHPAPVRGDLEALFAAPEWAGK